MPFSLGQILGGWRRKGDIKKVARFSDENSRRGRADANNFKNLDKERQRDKEFSGEKRAATSPTIKNKSELAWEVIRAPHISEKGSASGESLHIFKVVGDANKLTVKRAIEDRYGVEVGNVRMLNMPAKQRRRGQVLGERPGFKKAIVCLKEGQNISEF